MVPDAEVPDAEVPDAKTPGPPSRRSGRGRRGDQIVTSIFPVFSPRSIPRNASGALRSPSTTVSV